MDTFAYMTQIFEREKNKHVWASKYSHFIYVILFIYVFIKEKQRNKKIK